MRALARQNEDMDVSDEAAALGPLLATLPAWAIDQAPVPEERSVKETLQALTALDRDVYPAWLDQVEASGDASEAPAFTAPDLASLGEGANERDLDALLQDVRDAGGVMEPAAGARGTGFARRVCLARGFSRGVWR